MERDTPPLSSPTTALFDRISAWIASTEPEDSTFIDIPIKPQTSPTSGRETSRKRAFSDMSDAGDDRFTEQKRKHFRPIHPAPSSALGFIQDLEDAGPSDSVSQVDIDLAIRSAAGIRNLSIESVTSPEDASSSKMSLSTAVTSSAAMTNSKSKRMLLSTSTPNFKFLGLSGRAGLDPWEDINKWIPVGIRKLVQGFSKSMSPRGMICTCAKDVIVGYDDMLYWEDITFSDMGGNSQDHKQHVAEAEFLLGWIRQSNDMHVDTTEEADWVSHSIDIIKSVVSRNSFEHPLHAAMVTSVDLVREFCPRTRQGARSRSSSPRKKQRGRSGTVTSINSSRVTGGVMTARADITVLLRESGRTSSLFQAVDDKFGPEAYTPPFKNFTEPPIITLEAKSLDGSCLEAENQTAICANAILESWRCLGRVSAYNPTPLANYLVPLTESVQRSIPTTNLLEYPTIEQTPLNDLNTPSGASPIKIGVDHVIAIQVASYSWSYTIVFATPSGEDDAKVQAKRGYSRRVFGPHPIGDSRTVEGAYRICRFLHQLFIYKTRVWLPGIIQRDPMPTLDELSGL